MESHEVRICLRMPNWLGDSVMASAAFEALKNYFPHALFTLVGTQASCGIYSRDKRVSRIIIDTTKRQKNRFLATAKLAKEIGRHDIAIAFSNSFFSNLALFLTKTPIRIGYGKNLAFFLINYRVPFMRGIHQVLKYMNLASMACKGDIIAQDTQPSPRDLTLSLISNSIKFKKDDNLRYVGINPGAAYGSAKRWEEQYFIEIILHFLSNNCVVFLFGSENMLEGVENHISRYSSAHKENFINLIGKTSITELCDYIAMLDIFIANDSGPMHIAAALDVPLIALFGPTDSKDTSPWCENAIILDKNLPCAPCKKRVCPLKHHNCMKFILPDEVIENAAKILAR